MCFECQICYYHYVHFLNVEGLFEPYNNLHQCWYNYTVLSIKFHKRVCVCVFVPVCCACACMCVTVFTHKYTQCVCMNMCECPCVHACVSSVYANTHQMGRFSNTIFGANPYPYFSIMLAPAAICTHLSVSQ